VSNKDKTRLAGALVSIQTAIKSNEEWLTALYWSRKNGYGSPWLDRRIAFLEGRIGGQRACLETLGGI
jgi:hypothetical protein